MSAEFLLVQPDDRDGVVTAGDDISATRGTKHRFHHAGPEEVEMIFWFAPAGIEGLFAELFEHPENIVETGTRYGTEYCFDD